MIAARKYWQLIFAAGAFLPLHAAFTLSTAQGETSGTVSRPQSPGALEEARSFLAQGNAQEAIRILSNYLHSRPKDTAARLMLGQAYASANQNDRAEEEFRTVLRLAPDNYAAFAALGELYGRTGELAKAEPMLARAVSLSHGAAEIRSEWAVVLVRLHKYKEAQGAMAGLSPPADPAERIAFHRLRASISLGLGNAAQAAAEMEKALALKPDDMRLVEATAAAQLQAKNWQRAADLAEPVFSRTQNLDVGLTLLEAQLGIDGDFHTTLELLRSRKLPLQEELAFRQRLAEILIAHGEFADSIEELSKVAGIDPNRGDLRFNLALAQFKAGRLSDALATAEECKALGDSADVEDLLGDIQEASGDNLGAVRSYQAAVTLDPKEEKYRLSLGVELMRHQNFEAAKVVLAQAAELHPNSWRVQLALGLVEHFAGSDAEASRVLVHAAELAPEPKVALKYVGEVQMEMTSAPDPAALAQVCESANRHPKDGNLQFYCGALRFRRDNLSGNKEHTDETLRRLNAAASLLPTDASPHCQLAKAYRWLERWQDALRESETCAQMDPNSAEAHYRLAQIYQHFGQRERSRQEMKLHDDASKRIEDENARRDETMKTFLYTIQKETPDHN